MTFPKANSGIYIHTRYQDKDWPKRGYEAQVNNSHSDPKRTRRTVQRAGQLRRGGEGQRVVHV